jgi:hypothetical protein
MKDSYSQRVSKSGIHRLAMPDEVAGQRFSVHSAMQIGKEQGVAGAGDRGSRQRRRGTRVPTDFPAVLLAADRHTQVHCSAVDVSLSGTLLSVPGRRIERRERWRLWLVLPGGVLRVWARPVRWYDQEQAFEFIDLAAPERLELATYVHHIISLRPSN